MKSDEVRLFGLSTRTWMWGWPWEGSCIYVTSVWPCRTDIGKYFHAQIHIGAFRFMRVYAGLCGSTQMQDIFLEASPISHTWGGMDVKQFTLLAIPQPYFTPWCEVATDMPCNGCMHGFMQCYLTLFNAYLGKIKPTTWFLLAEL
jgi:hypothetical protein